MRTLSLTPFTLQVHLRFIMVHHLFVCLNLFFPVVQDAINSMNQFDLGGQYLRVGRAITPPDLKNTGSMDAKASAIPNASACKSVI